MLSQHYNETQLQILNLRSASKWCRNTRAQFKCLNGRATATGGTTIHGRFTVLDVPRDLPKSVTAPLAGNLG